MSKTSEDALINEILADAAKKAERTIHKAEEEAREILEKARREAESITKESAAAARERAEREKTIILATTGIEAKRLEIDAKEAFIRQMFDAAGNRLMDKKATDYPGLIARLIASAAKTMGVDSFVIALSKDDSAALNVADLRKKVSEKLGKNVTLAPADTPALIKAGVIVRSADGHMLVDNSLEGRLARMHEDLRRQAAHILFEEKA